MDMKNQPKYFFFLFTVLVAIILVLPNLLKHGMFMDGLLYSTVANNFAHGKGAFWHLYNSDTLHCGFYEQPPLYFWIMAGFYKIFGDSIFVERFYDFLMLLLSGFLIHKNWQMIVPGKLSKYSFFPVIFWITIPVCFWAYSNNMLEISVSVFALASSLFLFKYYFKGQKMVYLIMAGFFLIAGGLTKGFVAMFPLAIPFFYYLFIQRFSFKKWLLDSIVLSIIPVLAIGSIFLFETSRSGFTTYLTQRVFHSISDVSTVGSRFHIMERLVMDLLPLFFLIFLFFGSFFLQIKK
ncbi:MAG: glycosyltransferase family 39 protein, partial [Bacteroidales bacterium]|nr:glycosyltransferase family 39 protein [Bacteroidales bacterium]